MQVRKFEEQDYEVVCAWWDSHGWPRVPFTSLPFNGYLVDGTCAAFLYVTDSDLAIMEWIIGNPAVEKSVRGEALNNLIEFISKDAKNMGYKTIITMTKHSKLIDRFVSHGFMVTDENMIHLVKEL